MLRPSSGLQDRKGAGARRGQGKSPFFHQETGGLLSVLWRGSPAWLLWERDHLTLTPGKGTGGCPGGFSTIASGPRPTPLLGALQGDARGSDLARGGAGEGRGLSPGRWSPCLPPAPPSTWHQRPACYSRSFAQIGKAGMTPKAAAWGMGSGHRARPGPDHITFFACKVGRK